MCEYRQACRPRSTLDEMRSSRTRGRDVDDLAYENESRIRDLWICCQELFQRDAIASGYGIEVVTGLDGVFRTTCSRRHTSRAWGRGYPALILAINSQTSRIHLNPLLDGLIAHLIRNVLDSHEAHS